MNVAEDLFRNAETSEGTLVVGNDQTLTYGVATAHVRGLAGEMLARGVAPGDRVVLVLANGPEYIVAFYATLYIGAIAVAVPSSSPAAFCGAIASECDARLILSQGKKLQELTTTGRACLAVQLGAATSSPPYAGSSLSSPSGCAQIIFTSGTTGRPKGVMLSHSGLSHNVAGIVEYLKLTRDDRIGVVLDFSYSYGNSLLLTHVRVGGSLAILGSMMFPRNVAEQIVRTECTGFSGVPTTFALMINHQAVGIMGAGPLRYLTCAGGPLSVSDISILRETLPGIQLFVMYGQTEASARLSYLQPEELDRRPYSIGKGMPGVALDVCGPDGAPAADEVEGEIVASGENLMMGYWNDPVGTADAVRDGRLWTGDLGVRDSDGFIRVTGRRSELIKSAGFRIHPREVEEAIRASLPVHDCAVVGVPDPILGEKLVACIVGDTVFELGTVRRALASTLPDFKLPRHIVGVENIPRTLSGKVRRKDLATLAAEKLEDER